MGMGAMVLTRELHAELRALDLDAAMIAARLGMKRASVLKAEVKQGFRPRVRPSTKRGGLPRHKVDLAAVERFVRDGVPVTWIAETVRCDDLKWLRKVAREIRAGDRTAYSEWSSVWHAIRQNDDLKRLHQEFAPRSRRV
jgi:hypothetical protein